ncbi:hypothetical protein EG68_05112 [Paragonimus skrjabini miyazakii]|uniref:Uncharacterized protein n=1 Tax=Paragonimus skrjabini miyazakii TaxID=59628 RepID=A0A8S9YZP8_9TREM|nr:hypothetical protein EG68_05112 [Paragonimus skrjabini miyazakii]
MSLVAEGPIEETDKDNSCNGQQSVFNAVAAVFAHLIATQSKHVNQFPVTIFPGISTAAPTPWNSLSQDTMCLNQNQPDSTNCVISTNATSSTGWSSIKDKHQWISNDLQVKLQTSSSKEPDDTVLDLSSRKNNLSNTQVSLFNHSNYEQCWSNIPKPEEDREFISESEPPCQESNKLVRLSRHLATVMTKSSLEACLPYTLTEMFQVYQTILAEQHLTANLHKCDRTRQESFEYLTTNQAEVYAALPNHFGDIKNETPPVVVGASNISWQLPPVGTFRPNAVATNPSYPNASLDSVDGYTAIGGTNDPYFLNRYSPPLNFSAFAMDQNMVCPMCQDSRNRYR